MTSYVFPVKAELLQLSDNFALLRKWFVELDRVIRFGAILTFTGFGERLGKRTKGNLYQG